VTPTITGPTMTQPKVDGGALFAVGAGADVSFALVPKGNGSVNVFAGVSGADARVVANTQGAATDVNLNLIPRGTGKILINGVEAVTVSLPQTLLFKTLTTPIINGAQFSGNLAVDLGGGANGTVGVKVSPPATATSAGTPGQWASDTGFHYVCVGPNVWMRSPIATW